MQTFEFNCLASIYAVFFDTMFGLSLLSEIIVLSSGSEVELYTSTEILSVLKKIYGLLYRLKIFIYLYSAIAFSFFKYFYVDVIFRFVHADNRENAYVAKCLQSVNRFFESGRILATHSVLWHLQFAERLFKTDIAVCNIINISNNYVHMQSIFPLQHVDLKW